MNSISFLALKDGSAVILSSNVFDAAWTGMLRPLPIFEKADLRSYDFDTNRNRSRNKHPKRADSQVYCAMAGDSKLAKYTRLGRT